MYTYTYTQAPGMALAAPCALFAYYGHVFAHILRDITYHAHILRIQSQMISNHLMLQCTKRMRNICDMHNVR